MASLSPSLPQDLSILKEILFDTSGFSLAHLLPEPESADYAGYTFLLNGKYVRYREAHITPTKTGQFVTLWKRSSKGPIEPFSLSDPLDLVLISTRNQEQWGLFVFPKSILHQKGVVSDGTKEGKRALRVYPPWDTATNSQAKKTQQWQLDYFLEIKKESPIDFNRARRLLSV